VEGTIIWVLHIDQHVVCNTCCCQSGVNGQLAVREADELQELQEILELQELQELQEPQNPTGCLVLAP
jgi:hypothetical protein